MLIDHFKYTRKLDLLKDEDIYQIFASFLQNNFEGRLGYRFWQSWWLMLDHDEMIKHDKAHPNHKSFVPKSMHGFLKLWRSINFYVNTYGKLREKYIILPGMKFERHPPLALYHSEERALECENAKINFILSSNLLWKNNDKQHIEPGITMKLLKLYNNKLDKFTMVNKSKLNTKLMVRTVSDNINFFTKSVWEKRKRDLWLIMQTMNDLKSLIGEFVKEKL